MEFHEKVEYFISILKKSNSNHYDEEALEALENLLEEYVRNYKERPCMKHIK